MLQQNKKDDARLFLNNRIILFILRSRENNQQPSLSILAFIDND